MPGVQVIGALAWSITASAAEVTFDLFFDEDANLGCALRGSRVWALGPVVDLWGGGEAQVTLETCRQKIQLSENIEKSLVMMKCPHELQAHQIQGLDFPAVFPVVRWLVKKVRGPGSVQLSPRLPPLESSSCGPERLTPAAGVRSR
jgi:hypothetical protein